MKYLIQERNERPCEDVNIQARGNTDLHFPEIMSLKGKVPNLSYLTSVAPLTTFDFHLSLLHIQSSHFERGLTEKNNLHLR